MLDTYRRRELTRIMLDSNFTSEDIDFLKTSAHFHENGCMPIEPSKTLIYAEKILCALGKKIPAIKSARDRLRLGLLEAKNMIDAYCATREHQMYLEQYAPVVGKLV